MDWRPAESHRPLLTTSFQPPRHSGLAQLPGWCSSFGSLPELRRSSRSGRGRRSLSFRGDTGLQRIDLGAKRFSDATGLQREDPTESVTKAAAASQGHSQRVQYLGRTPGPRTDRQKLSGESHVRCRSPPQFQKAVDGLSPRATHAGRPFPESRRIRPHQCSRHQDAVSLSPGRSAERSYGRLH